MPCDDATNLGHDLYEKILPKDQILSFLLQRQFTNNSTPINENLHKLSRQDLLKKISSSEILEILYTIRLSEKELIKIKIIYNFLSITHPFLFSNHERNYI